MDLVYREVVPGSAIGSLGLGMSRSQVHAIVGSFSVLPGYASEVWQCGSVRIWFDEREDRVSQLMIEKGFSGQVVEDVGVGTRLDKAEKILGPWKEDLDCYFFRSLPFTSFGCDDLDTDENEVDPVIDELAFCVVDISVFVPGNFCGCPLKEEQWNEWWDGLPGRLPFGHAEVQSNRNA